MIYRPSSGQSEGWEAEKSERERLGEMYKCRIDQVIFTETAMELYIPTQILLKAIEINKHTTANDVLAAELGG